ncbi:MAG: hypothetical protein QXJ69_01790 [Desulfurococcaceae archaeon]
MLRKRRKLRGQSEVIGGIIVLTALIISMGFVLTSLGKLSSSSVTGISRRTLFETEKSFEQLDALVSGGVCYIRNTGNIPLTITRIWFAGKPIDIPPSLYSTMTLQPGGNKSITEIKSILNIDKIDYAVSSRGNVFPVESMCIQQQQSQINIYYSSGGMFTSEDILNTTKIVRGLEQMYIYANISEKSESTHAVIYNYTNTWYCSSMFNKNIIPGQNINSDADGNGINELIITTASDCTSSTYEQWRKKNFEGNVTFVFRYILNVTEYIDILTVYFKVLVLSSGGGVAQQISVYPTVIISNENATLQSPATVTTGGARQNVATIFGSAIFPIRAFGQQLPQGNYNLVIRMEITAKSIEITGIRLEYIAVVGAGYTVYWTTQ